MISKETGKHRSKVNDYHLCLVMTMNLVAYALVSKTKNSNKNVQSDDSYNDKFIMNNK